MNAGMNADKGKKNNRELYLSRSKILDDCQISRHSLNYRSSTMIKIETIAERKLLREILLIIPCSATKKSGLKMCETGPQISHYLPANLANQLDRARARVREGARVDERTLVPAWQLYDGYFYTAAQEALSAAVRTGVHVLIISGGYGVLLADELIGNYSARFELTCWPEDLLEKVIASYARHHRLKHMRAFLSANSDDRKLVERVHWRAAGVDDAVLLIPKFSGQGDARTVVPRAQGQMMEAFIKDELKQGWRSSDGLSMNSIRLHK